MLEHDIAIEDDIWTSFDPEKLVQQVFDVMDTRQPDGYRDGIVSFLFADNDAIQSLNKEWRDKDKPTNVLSFPADPMPPVPGMPQPVGDIALAFGVCIEEAKMKKISTEHHILHLIVHGLLHLFGYDHVQDEEATHMENMERQVLAELGVADPYAAPL